MATKKTKLCHSEEPVRATKESPPVLPKGIASPLRGSQ